MKCRSCGANYPTKELHCPYCGTQNPKGHRWHRQRVRAREDYRRAGETVLPALRLQSAHRVVNRLLLAEAVLLALLVAGIFLAFFLEDRFGSFEALFDRGGLEEEFARLYEEEDFGQLYHRLDESGLFGGESEELYQYSQMALLHYDYREFELARADFYREIREGEPDEYTLSRLIRRIHALSGPYSVYAYPELTPGNAARLEDYREEALGFARNVLGMSGGELELLCRDDLTGREEDTLQRDAAQRRYWDE